MPKRIELSPHATTEELEHRYRKAKDPVERSHHQIVWLLSEGKKTEEVCEVTGYSPGWVRKIARRYNERGVDALGDRRHSNPGARGRALLDEAGEEELLVALQGPPPAWVGGGMWSGPKVALWIAQRNGLEKVHVQRGFEYLRRARYSPQVPRPSNARAEDSEREAFKKSPAEAGGAAGSASGGRGGAVGRGRGAAGAQAGDEEGVGPGGREARCPL
jgi:transposase